MSARLRYGVLGCGDAAARLFIPGLLGAESSELAAIASRDPGRAREQAARFDCAAVDSYEQLIARTDIDVVYIGVPVALHREWALKAIRAGKHVYCEKTLAPSLSETSEVLDAATEAGTRIAEGLMYRFHPLFLAVREQLAGGDLGHLRSFVGSFGFALPSDDSVRRDPAMKMGVLNETGCYPVSAARLAFDRMPDAVIAELAEEDGVDFSGSALLQFEGKGSAYCEFGFDRSYRNSYTAWCSRGSIRVERAYTTPSDFKPVIEIRNVQGTTETVELVPANHFTRIVDAFGHAIATDSDHDLFEGDARRQAMTLEAVRVSARENAPVRVEEIGADPG